MVCDVLVQGLPDIPSNTEDINLRTSSLGTVTPMSYSCQCKSLESGAQSSKSTGYDLPWGGFRFVVFRSALVAVLLGAEV